VAVCPLATVLVSDPPLAAPRLTLGAVPVPVRATLCVPVGALSVTVKVPVSEPICESANWIEIWQDAEAARLVPHVFVSGKSCGDVIFVMVSASVPVFVRVMTEAALCVP